MKSKVKKIAAVFLAGAMCFMTMGDTAFAKTDTHITASGQSNITIDGYFDDWADKPCSWEYNWDNSANCWYWGVWIDGVCYKTEEGTYDENVRHKMSLYSDGEYVYLYVKISRDYGARFNGEDYQFWFGDQMAAFQVEKKGGGTLTGNVSSWEPGVYEVEVRHRDSALSYRVAEGSEAYLRINENNINNELEIKIPLKEMKAQNKNINLDDVKTIEFFTPNLMYRRIKVTGTSTAPYVGIAASVIPVVAVLALRKRKQARQ